MKAALIAALILGALTYLVYISHPDPPRTAAQIANEAAEEKKIDAARSEIKSKVELMIKKGGVTKLDCDLHKAWIDPLLWLKADAQLKEDITDMLAIYCGANRIDVFDAQTARQLASYRIGEGFKAY